MDLLLRLRSAAGIVLQCVGAAVLYGVLHDLVTAHVCVEYFTIAHPMLVPSDNPVVMALLWGVVATWWVGLLLGVALAVADCAGARPKLSAPDLWRPMGRLLAAMGASALIAGVAGYAAAEAGRVWLVPPWSTEIPPDRHARFFFDAFAHTASYLVAVVGGLVLIGRTWRRRAALVLLLALLTPPVLAGDGLAEVARRMGCRLYVEPEVRLRSADVQGLSPEEALARLLPAGAEWRRVGDILVVRRPTACWQHVPRDESWRLQDNWQEYRLERATRAEVVPLLRAEYPTTAIHELPTEEGFFVVASTRGIYREVKVRLFTLDVPHPPTEPRPRVSLPIRHASAGAVASVLARLLPEARISADAEVVSVEGPAEVRGWAVPLVELLDEDPPQGRGPHARASSTGWRDPT